MKPISKRDALGKIRASKGRIFTATIIKRTNGERREMNCRLGVTKYVAKKNLVTVFDMQKKAYRMINIDGLEALKIDGEEFTIEDNA